MSGQSTIINHVNVHYHKDDEPAGERGFSIGVAEDERIDKIEVFLCKREKDRHLRLVIDMNTMAIQMDGGPFDGGIIEEHEVTWPTEEKIHELFALQSDNNIGG